jgi:hopanoid biosynthesis associated radical SAM protein HpnH
LPGAANPAIIAGHNAGSRCGLTVRDKALKKSELRANMGIPITQMWTVASYVIRQKLARRKQYPLVLMLEPLFRCNLACAGCGKIQYPAHILKKQLTPEQCFKAVDECGAPMVSIPGGEPLLHPQIKEIVEGLVARKKYIYLCTNALLLKEKIDLFKPTKYLTFSVHMDGQKEHHDFSVCREGGYDIALDGIREAVARGFRVTTNTTLFDGADPVSVRAFFDEMTDIGVEGMMLSPGYSYDKAPDQQHFLGRKKTRKLFSTILSNRSKRWVFNQSPLFLEFLMGKRHYTCTPWGMPTYNIFGWQKPCYLLADGYADSFAELMETTSWESYGTESGNKKCANCMVHSGYEASAVNDTFGSVRGLWATVRSIFFNGGYVDEEAKRALDEAPGAHGPVVQLSVHGKEAHQAESTAV